MLSFLIDTIASFFPLLLGFHLGGHRAYLDLLHWACEIIIEGKRIRWKDISPGGMFLEDFEFCTG